MYVYVQGRRLPRRTTAPQTPRSAAPARAPRTEALDELISKSLELCDNAERKLETVAGSLETLDGPPRRHPSAASGRSADRLPRPWTGSARAAAVCAPRAGQEQRGIGADELARMLEERERALLKRTEYLEHRATWLESHLGEARSEKRLLENKIKQLEAASRSHAVAPSKATAVRRRYHFAVAGDSLQSSLNDMARETGYFDVKCRPPTAGDATGEGLDRHIRFAYTDRPCDAFFSMDEAASTPDLLDATVVSTWLEGATPRSSADAVPLLVLAKDLLRRLVSKEITFFDARVGVLEARVRKLESDLAEARHTVDNFDAIRAKEGQELQQQFEARLAQLNADWQKRFGQCVKKLTPLALRNATLQSRVRQQTQRWRDVLAETPGQVIDRWSVQQKISALRSLLEQDKVNFFLPDDFAQNVKFSERSMVHWCQLFLMRFEHKYSGSAALLQMVCDVFRSSKEVLARKILVWYNAAETSLDEDVKTALDAENVEKSQNPEILQMRNDLLNGQRDIWDFAAQLLQVPRENAMAELLGFGPEDQDLIMGQWPQFLAWFYQERSTQILVDPPLAVTAAWARLKDSDMWPQVCHHSVLSRHALFDVQNLPPAHPLELDELSATIVELYARHASEDDTSVSALSPPQYVRYVLIKMADSRGLAQKRSARLQAAVRELQHHNTRVRIFSRLVGMSEDPSTEYNPSCFHFAMTFWQGLIQADSEGQCQLKTLATWLEGTWARGRCVEGTWARESDELASSALGGWNCKARATGGAEGSMHGAGHSSKREKGGDSQELRRHPSRVVSGKGAREDADEGARSVRRGAVDRAVDIDVAARALLAAAQELLIIPPETASSFGQLPAVEEVKALFDSACVSVHCGTCLPLNDHEKKKCFTEVDEKGEKGGGGSISFDLASGLALDWWYRLIDQYQEHISQLWAVNEAYWDCGSNLSSPDLADLRLFLGQTCNLMFAEDELIQLYLEMCSHDDTIDRKEAAQCIARRLHRARRLNVSTERGGNDSSSVVDHSELNLKPQG